jgi:hypothetical protein
VRDYEPIMIRSAAALACVLVATGCSGSSSSSSASPAPTDDAGADAGGPLALAPGDVAEVPVTDGVARATFDAHDTNEQYVVVVASTRFDTSGAELPWSVATDAAPDGASDPAGAGAALVTGCSLSADAWKAASIAPETPPSGTAVVEGATKTLHAPTPTGFEDIDVKAIAVSKSAVVWADVTAAHPATLDTAFVSQFLTDFESTILPRERSVFGVESDLDGDGHIALVFTPLTNKTAVAFFTGCDLDKWVGCAATNAGEYLWLTPPNAIQPPYNTPNAIKEILTHELSHLIHFNRKVVRNKLSDWTDSGYMVEGIGGFAQDAIGPQAGNLYVAQAGLDGIDQFSLGDTLVDGTPYDPPRDGVMRGGSYLFVRWLYDRAGGDTALSDGTVEGRGGPALVRALLDSPDSVATTLPVATKSAMADIGVDFYTALAMSNRDEAGGVAPTNACFSYLPVQIDPVTGKQRGADVFAKYHGTQMNGVAVAKGTSGTVRAGGVAYATISPPASGAPMSVAVTVDAKASPRVRIGRLH